MKQEIWSFTRMERGGKGDKCQKGEKKPIDFAYLDQHTQTLTERTIFVRFPEIRNYRRRDANFRDTFLGAENRVEPWVPENLPLPQTSTKFLSTERWQTTLTNRWCLFFFSNGFLNGFLQCWRLGPTFLQKSGQIPPRNKALLGDYENPLVSHDSESLSFVLNAMMSWGKLVSRKCWFEACALDEEVSRCFLAFTKTRVISFPGRLVVKVVGLTTIPQDFFNVAIRTGFFFITCGSTPTLNRPWIIAYISGEGKVYHPYHLIC